MLYYQACLILPQHKGQVDERRLGELKSKDLITGNFAVRTAVSSLSCVSGVTLAGLDRLTAVAKNSMIQICEVIAICLVTLPRRVARSWPGLIMLFTPVR
jgi:hypothetical protein